MSHKTVKASIAANLKANGFAPSNAMNFTDAPTNEYGNTFIVKALSGENEEGNAETIADRFYDEQVWQIQIAFARSEQSEVNALDTLHRKKDVLLPYLDDQDNWRGNVRVQKYKSWEVIEQPSYYILDIRLKIVDQYIYL